MTDRWRSGSTVLLRRRFSPLRMTACLRLELSMRRPTSCFAITAVAAAFIGLTPGSSGADAVGWTDVQCVAGANNVAEIERSLVDNNVRVHGFCGVDWSK